MTDSLHGDGEPLSLLPDRPAHVHLMGICGTGMSALAGMFHEIGLRVTGSDQGMYPPVSDFLRGLGIHVTEGYRPENLDPRPDLVVVGNVIRRANPEAAALQMSGIPYTTLPAALTRYFADGKTRIVVTGTHGKTTVSAMIAWILYAEGLDPGFMIGGIAGHFGRNYRLGRGSHFVVEGDEYDTAYFEKTPKFLHYQPDVGVITSCEFDHGDIYASLDEIKEQFRSFVRLIPPNGRLIANLDDAEVADVAAAATVEVEGYKAERPAEWTVKEAITTTSGMEVTFARNGREAARGTLPVTGFHNVLNALAAVAVAAGEGVSPGNALSRLESFRGVKRRQEVVGEEAGVTVIDDFAHHPTAVKVTCSGIRRRYPNSRLVAVFEPRTNTSRRAVFQTAYVSAFSDADLIVLREPRDVEAIPEADRFNSTRLAADLRNESKQAWAFGDTDGIVAFLSTELHYGDVVLIMSNGSFDGLVGRVLAMLKER
ncbi:MAG: UDP-N-acetylmuramate:L-alanyl-gamma-D-glutamyl-meso-diaminopimelate ligase [Desulfomonile sp.]|nr:UDP-N-acetylmuramate:L-alanyl-gamma-D-glutamyl-meso-diaminopimelate ligase [Desulfomonile sp.]